MSQDATDLLRSAVAALRAGGLVAFPTETVYGLGADARNAEAVLKIFAAKGRPSTNPLIVHVANLETAKRYAAKWSDAAQTLAAVWWPGPLALVVPKTAEIVDPATAGRPTVALRVPDHPLALQLLQEFGGPVAAPSANRSNRVSPTTAQHVRDELGDAVDVVLDGGPCAVGIESTVVDLTGARPVILRPGGVPRRNVEAIVGPVEVFGGDVPTSEAAASPGQHATHYAPRTPAFRFETSQRGLIHPRAADGTPNGMVCVGTMTGSIRKWGPIVAMPREPALYAHHFYAVLRELDAMGLREIFVEVPPARPEWEAVRDRIRRATRPLEEAASLPSSREQRRV
jgi:L-threonylcarbamoyladenylate synthase